MRVVVGGEATSLSESIAGEGEGDVIYSYTIAGEGEGDVIYIYTIVGEGECDVVKPIADGGVRCGSYLLLFICTCYRDCDIFG